MASLHKIKVSADEAEEDVKMFEEVTRENGFNSCEVVHWLAPKHGFHGSHGAANRLGQQLIIKESQMMSKRF